MKVQAPTLDRVSLEQIANNTNEVINFESFQQTAKINPQDFTRNRKLPFVKLILFLLNFAKSSSQVALIRFFKLLPNPIKSINQQAFSKARKKNWLAFKFLFFKNVKKIYRHGNNKWHNCRVLTIDGS